MANEPPQYNEDQQRNSRYLSVALVHRKGNIDDDCKMVIEANRRYCEDENVESSDEDEHEGRHRQPTHHARILSPQARTQDRRKSRST